MQATWSKRLQWHTTYSADSVEWCPVEQYRSVLVCGTYQLQKPDSGDKETTEKQTRLGRIYLFLIDDDTTELTPIQTIDTAGILDQKWCYHTLQGSPALAVVTSVGTLQLYKLTDKKGTLELVLWLEEVIASEGLALSVDWSTNRTSSELPRIVVSDSTGSLHVLQVSGDGLEILGKWNTHSFEAWIGAFNYWNTDVFYSGGDDCMFKSYDVRVPEITTSVNKSHEAGVTAIRSHIEVEHQLLTGSYDEKVRVWDTRKLKSCLKETNVNGGVWRLKYHPYQRDTVLAACMYGGFRVLSAGDQIQVLSEYMAHESIAYGADWKFNQRTSLVATCSFYDCQLHISEIIF